jgi:hypothetical protein
MSEPLQITIRVDYLSAMREELRCAMEPQITWKGDPKQAEEDARTKTMWHMSKVFSMLTDIAAVGVDRAYDTHLPTVAAHKK